MANEARQIQDAKPSKAWQAKHGRQSMAGKAGQAKHGRQSVAGKAWQAKRGRQSMAGKAWQAKRGRQSMAGKAWHLIQGLSLLKLLPDALYFLLQWLYDFAPGRLCSSPALCPDLLERCCMPG